MFYKALVSFGGIDVSMVAGETRELSDNLANDLLRAGYIEKIEPAQKADNETPKDEETAKPKKKRTTKK